MSGAEYQTIVIERSDQVARLVLKRRPSLPPGQPPPNRHWELANAFDELRADSSIRIIVLTGTDTTFSVPPHSVERDRTATSEERGSEYPVDPARTWHNMTGVIRTHQVMAEIEKPIVARVNGDAIGFGQSLVFGSDLIVAVEDAVIADHHLGMGEIEQGGHLFGTVPGDGGMSLAPLYMTPARAKEYLMLGRAYRARELAALGIINYAVPFAELDATVNGLVERLLKRPAYALAWTKRVANRRVVDHLNMTLDAGAGYEMTAFLQLEKQGWIDKRDLT